MDPEPANIFYYILATNSLNFGGVLELVVIAFILILLIISSALISGSEIAFFSLSPKDMDELEESDSIASDIIISLKKKPKTLLATILIANNFINIGIVILSDYFIRIILGLEQLSRMGQYCIDYLGINYFNAEQVGNSINFLITVVGVTFILVLFGEVIPKVYANVNNMKFSIMMSRPLSILTRRLVFFSKWLINGTDFIEKRLSKSMSTHSISKEHIDKAIDITVEKSNKNKADFDILKGIVKFNEVVVKEIMKPRVDVVSIEENTPFNEVFKLIESTGYSRIPVHKEDFDNIIGILYVKDLINRFDQKSFSWQSLIRTDVFYAPETKKINELLKEFQEKRVHIAIVVDEYGGSSGLITMEDIMEEIIGEISDEFDSKNFIDFVKINKNNYIFDGKTSLHDVAKTIDVDSDIFDNYKGEADSIAGLLLEIHGVLPQESTEFELEDLVLVAKNVSDRRIVKVLVITKREK